MWPFRRRTLILPGTAIVSCLTCGLSHRLPTDPAQSAASERGFRDRHAGHSVTTGRLASPAWQTAYGGSWNADIKVALQSVQTMTVTNLHSLANSATAGWQSAVVDNTSNLFLDALVMVVLDFSSGGPGSSKAAFLWAYGGIESGVSRVLRSGTAGHLERIAAAPFRQGERRWSTKPRP